MTDNSQSGRNHELIPVVVNQEQETRRLAAFLIKNGIIYQDQPVTYAQVQEMVRLTTTAGVPQRTDQIDATIFKPY